MTRTGKIARLPQAIRDELNCRLADGEPGGSLLPWLNSLPVARAVLQSQFGGAAITKQNLSEWRKGGFSEWRARQELLSDAHQFSAGARKLREASEGRLTDDLSTVLAAEYAILLNDWNGTVDESVKARLRVLHGLSQAIGILRQGDCKIEQLKFGREKLAFAREKAGMETMPHLQELACDPALRDIMGVADEGKVAMEELLNLVAGASDVAGPAEAPQPSAVAAIAAEADVETEARGVQPGPTWSNLVQPGPTWSNENIFAAVGDHRQELECSGIFTLPVGRATEGDYTVAWGFAGVRVSGAKAGGESPGRYADFVAGNVLISQPRNLSIAA